LKAASDKAGLDQAIRPSRNRIQNRRRNDRADDLRDGQALKFLA
jgi:hypothetical protein